MSERSDEIWNLFPKRLREIFSRLSLDENELQEIRLRAQKPIFIRSNAKEYALSEEGRLVFGERFLENTSGRFLFATERDLSESLELMGSYSLYAAEEQLRQGFLTVPGGHRIGVCGEVIADGARVLRMKWIRCLNVRVAHEVKGCADAVMPFLLEGQIWHNTLVISPPCTGKTTLLRDMVRQISNAGLTVGVVDERSELAASFQGVAQNDLGPRTDVMDACPKAQGMMMLVRSMAPRVIAVDEIGGEEDLNALSYIQTCGCSFAATIHGASFAEVLEKPGIRRMAEGGTFSRCVLLQRGESISPKIQVFDGKGSLLCG